MRGATHVASLARASHPMEMVQRYMHLAQAEIEEAYRQALPAHNLDLRV